MKNTYRIMLVLLMGIFTLISCEHEPTGIFSRIQNEAEILASNLGGSLTIKGIVRQNERYYAAAIGLHSRSIDSREWNKVPLPGGFDIATDIEKINTPTGGRIFCGFTTFEADRHGLFERNTTDNTWGPDLLPEEYTDSEIVRLIAANDQLFVVIRTETVAYDLVHVDLTTDSISRIEFDFDMNMNTKEHLAEIIDGDYVATTTDNGEYVFISRSVIYTLDDTLMSNQSADPTISSYIATGTVRDVPTGFDVNNNELSGIVVDDVTAEIYISSSDGFIYYSRNGKIGPWHLSERNSDHAYTDMMLIGEQGNKWLVVGLMEIGTVEGGYREITLLDNTADNNPFGSVDIPSGDIYQSTDMSNTSVGGFYIDDADPTMFFVFVLSHGAGLWRANYGSPPNVDTDPTLIWE